MKRVSINRIVAKSKSVLLFLTHENGFQRRLKYLWFRKGSDSLLVLFPGFSNDKLSYEVSCSKQDPTYECHIKDLINSLDYYGCHYSETFESYATHSQVGE